MALDIDEDQVKKAFRSLLKHSKSLPEAEHIWLSITTFNRIERRSVPTRIPLKHSLHVPGARRCLFTRNPQSRFQDIFKSKNIKGIHRIIDIGHIKKKYKTIESRKELMDEFDVFFADQRVLPDLPVVLGKGFYKKRSKTPIPFHINASDLQKEVLSGAKSSYMNFCKGTSHMVAIATTTHNAFEAIDNFYQALPHIVNATAGGADNIRNLHIKTPNSTSLPIFDASGKDQTFEELVDEDDENESDEE